MSTPDTTRAVYNALLGGLPFDSVEKLTADAIVADRWALEEAGYAIIEVGSVPPWMKLVNTINLTHDDGSGWFENVYRLTGEGDS